MSLMLPPLRSGLPRRIRRPIRQMPPVMTATPVDVAYIGACTGAKLEDLAMAASVLKDRKPAPGVSLLVAPASRLDQDRAEALGLMKVLEDADARVLPTSCGICAGYGSERLGEDVTCISSTARNFKGPWALHLRRSIWPPPIR